MEKDELLKFSDEISFGKRLKAARERKGFYQNQLAEKLELTSGRIISNWENDIARPDVENMVKLCQMLEISASYILGYYGETPEGNTISTKDFDLLKTFNNLDNYGRELVLDVISHEKKRIEETGESRFVPKNNSRYIKYFDFAASAGTGQYMDDIKGERILVPLNEITENADFVIPIAGDSMEPDYSDGDLVCVKICDSLEMGDIGVLMLNGEAFIKRYEGKRLVSLNKKYKDIIINDDDSIFCRGYVLGKTETL